ncbi:butyrophilin subfamily 2 member A2 [Notolabrus celidotus]|uniref:butyrophilin subfamily 2 member A2 n=1 Tax=Notolabrus celidotus TaxID=1203425 RepID=UPI00148FE827|nr:butyrophilin subfamily 2 member A2 [Notolabrus celidotus]
MASTSVLLFIIVIFIREAKSNSFVKVNCTKEIIGGYDHQSLLNCVIQTSEVVKDPEIRGVTWGKKGNDKPVLVFDGDNIKPLSRYSFAEPSWNKKNMNISLLIHKTAVEDEGVYTCMVYTNSGTSYIETSLKVNARYTVPTFQSDPKTINLDTGGTLTCHSTGYPKGQLRWFDKDNKEWIKIPETEVTQTGSGLFSLSSTMTLVPRSIFTKYICKVFNAGGNIEAENTFEVKDPPSTGEQRGPGSDASALATKIGAPVVVIGSLIVGLLLILLVMHRRRSLRGQRAVPVQDCEEDCSLETIAMTA